MFGYFYRTKVRELEISLEVARNHFYRYKAKYLALYGEVRNLQRAYDKTRQRNKRLTNENRTMRKKLYDAGLLEIPAKATITSPPSSTMKDANLIQPKWALTGNEPAAKAV